MFYLIVKMVDSCKCAGVLLIALAKSTRLS